MAAETTGQCAFCGETFASNVMTRHVTACGTKAAQGKKTASCFHLVVSGRWSSACWLHLAASPRAALSQLDQFLRDIWLECCGHLSAFEYDYGSTTELTLKVAGERIWPAAHEAIRPVARNHQPEVKCDQCKSAPARQICTECAWSDKGWLCEACATKHKCGEDMFLPVVNSPRVGVCGYTG